MLPDASPILHRWSIDRPADFWRLAWDKLGLPGRVVENLFWVGRYAERSESGLRLLRTVFVELHGTEPLPVQAYPILLRAVTHLTTTYPGFVSGDDALLANPEPELLAVASDRHRPGSIASSLGSLLGAWGVNYDPARVVGDMQYGIGNGMTRHIGILSVPASGMNSDDIVSADLEIVNFSSTGWAQPVEGAETTFEILVHSSENAAPLDASRDRQRACLP